MTEDQIMSELAALGAAATRLLEHAAETAPPNVHRPLATALAGGAA